MAIQKAILVSFAVQGDGVSTQFHLDFLTDPYFTNGPIVNWFANEKKLSSPVGLTMSSTNWTGTLSGTIGTFTAISPPAAIDSVTLYLLFP